MSSKNQSTPATPSTPASTTPKVTPTPAAPADDAGAVSISERHAELLDIVTNLEQGESSGNHSLNCDFTPKQNIALDNLRFTLMRRMARLASGQYVRTRPDSIDWLLEAIGNVPLNPAKVFRTDGEKLKEAQDAAHKARGIITISVKLGELGAKCHTPVRLKEYCDSLRKAAIEHGCTIEIFGHDDWTQRQISITGRQGKPEAMIAAVKVKPPAPVPAGLIAKPGGTGEPLRTKKKA